MSTSGIPDDAADPQRVQRIIDDFLRAWKGDAEAEIASYLPPVTDPDRLLICSRLVAIDLQHRCQRGQAVLLEGYLRRYPELQSSPRFVELLHEEYVVRRRLDPSIEISSYRARFPRHYDALLRKDQQLRPDDGDLDTLRPSTIRPVGTTLPRAKSDNRREGAEHAGSSVHTQGKYDLIEPLGRGQFGEVWRAEAPGGVEVAVKIINFPVGHKMTQLELQSLEVMKKLRHSYLLQVQAYWIDDDQLYVVMELGDETLHDLAERYAALHESIPSGKLINYFMEASEAVDFLHSQHVLHRDIKPANILLVSGHVKVADFGIARVVGDEHMVTATTMGTPLYMAPEVWQGKASTRSDQYSLAMTYAELRMGRSPYSGKSAFEVMNQHLKRAPDLEPLDPRERNVVGKALAKEPKDRFASCTEFATALRESLQPKRVDPARSALLTKWLLGAVVLLSVLLGVAAFIYPGRPGSARITVDPSRQRVEAGRSVSVEVSVIEGQVSASNIDLQGLPTGVTFTREVAGAHVTFTFNVGHDVPPADYAGRLVGIGVPGEEYIHLSVQPAAVVMVEGFELSESSRVVGGRAFADRIYCTRGGQRIEFVLIPHESTDDPPTFYMQKTKVTNRLFAIFVAESSSTASLNEQSRNWYLGGIAGTEGKPANENPDHPVYGVHIEDAEACADWLGGRLPSTKQWDKAAGRGETEYEGPFTFPLSQLTPQLVTFNRKREGPSPVGTAIADVSIHSCTDMAGNGYEYTRTSSANIDVSSVSELREEDVVVRGMSYWDGQPFTFSSPDLPQSYDDVSRDVSFRVVIEDNRWRN